MKTKTKIFFIFFLVSSLSFSQNALLEGSVKGQESIENIHVINRSQKLYATTNDKGFFKIEAKKKDTIVFTSVQYKIFTYIISADDIKNKTLDINLEVHVNELPEAVIGFTLTGDLTKDILNSDAKRPIDFYDFGIPGYTGKRKTKNERRLQEASDFAPKAGGSLGGAGGSIGLTPLINALSGRTKELKKIVALEANTKLMNALKNRLSEAFFKENELEEDLRADFFYFCAEDKTFEKRCASSDLEALTFMKEKHIQYKENLAIKE
ncbi:hypothetical protein [Lacinutrix jangbogonensis]|uniref:hypothetical protein n=1 Tax=Lacinutrix jangbogonensis TaxID=1469557 RepID=UPI00053E8112|nr:hypothetical protein [Lacinutrix jangbogonensis]